GCKHPADDAPSLTSATRPAPAVVEFARVADAGEATVVRTVAYKGSEVRLAEVRRFKIARAGIGQSGTGTLAVDFELAEGEKKAFSDWTESFLGKGLVILVDGEPVMMATVRSRLPGSGQIDFGAQPR